MTSNTVYTVTPPDFSLSTIGPSALLLGVPFTEIKPYTSVYERLFPEIEIVFYASETGINSDNLAWYRAVAGVASSIFVDLDNITSEELFIAMQAENDDRVMVFWISHNNDQPDLRKLLNNRKC